jgi:cytochrome c556
MRTGMSASRAPMDGSSDPAVPGLDDQALQRTGARLPRSAWRHTMRALFQHRQKGEAIMRSTGLVLAFVALSLTPMYGAANDAIEYRQNVLRAVGGHMNASAAIVRGQVPHREQLVRHARSIDEMANVVPTLFPEGSGAGNTDALPAIWDRRDTFEARLQAFQEAAARFHEVVADDADTGTIGRAMLALGQSCRDCHNTFRRN